MVPIKSRQLLETPKALDTMNNSNNSKDTTMDNQQPSLQRKLKKGSETMVLDSNIKDDLDIRKDEDIVRTTVKAAE